MPPQPLIWIRQMIESVILYKPKITERALRPGEYSYGPLIIYLNH